MKRRLTTLFVLVGFVLCPTIAHAETKTTESTTQVQSESQAEYPEDSLEDMSDTDILGVIILALLVSFGMAKLLDEKKRHHPH